VTRDKTAAIRFGRRIAAARAAQGWNRSELGRLAQVTPGQLMQVERGTRSVHLDSAARIAAAAGITLDGLLGPCGQCRDDPPAGFTCNACGIGAATPCL
jgi:transcriptional regulator with XRE-family HTH domain